MATLDQSQVAGSTLGYAQITSNFATSSTTAVQVTGLSVTVTIPSGGRRVKITAYVGSVTPAGLSTIGLSIWDGTVGTGTLLNWSQQTITTSSYLAGIPVFAVVTPAAGSKTYNVGLSTSGGSNTTVNASSTQPPFILVELI